MIDGSTPGAVGVRFDPRASLIVCTYLLSPEALTQGRRVLVEGPGEAPRREGMVVLPPDLIAATVSLQEAPQVVAVLDDPSLPSVARVVEEIAFLPADDAAIDRHDLAEALLLAALPVPPMPERRR